MNWRYFCLYGLILPVQLVAQEFNLEKFTDEMYEQYVEESGDEIDAESFIQQLQELLENKVDLNHCTKEDLERLIFLDDSQVEELLFYIYQQKGIRDLKELQLVEGLDMTDIRRILPFVYIGNLPQKSEDEISLKNLITKGKTEIITQFDRIIELKEGYKSMYKNSRPAYAGDNLHHSLRMKYHYRDKVYASVTMEKDAGEAFSSSNALYYDAVGASVQINGKGWIKQVNLGDFQASFGQGLVMNLGFKRGKQSDITGTFARFQGIRRFSSTNEFNYLRGAGISFANDNWKMDVFFSVRNPDADTSGGSIGSFYKTGYHRTDYEIYKKGTLTQMTTGFHYTYRFSKGDMGITSYYSSLNSPLRPGTNLYQYFNFSGRDQFCFGVDHRFILGKFQFFGEAALSDHSHPAWIEGVQFAPSPGTAFTIIGRDYPADYQSLFSNAFAESGRGSNERGIYIGGTWTPFNLMELNFYSDSYHFPWSKFASATATSGNEFNLGFKYSGITNAELRGRIRYEVKEQNSMLMNGLMQVAALPRSSFRLQTTFRLSPYQVKIGMECNLLKMNDAEHFNYLSKSVCAYQDLTYQSESGDFVLNFRYAFFDVPDFENRMYVYEDDILYNFSVPALTGVGSRYYLNAKYKINSNLSLWAKFAVLQFADGRRSIGSGNEQIEGSQRSEIKILLRWLISENKFP